MRILDKEFELYLSEEQIQQEVQSLAARIKEDYKHKDPYFIIVLNGSLFFAVELMKHIDISCRVDSIKCSSYVGLASTHELKFELDFTERINGQDILVVEDIVDTGFTLMKIQERLQAFAPASCKYVSLFLKPHALQYPVQLDYVGMEIPNDFVVGYGLDYNGQGRNLPALYRLKS